MERTGSFLFSLILMIPVGLFGGLVFADMWGWFITPVFTEMPTLNTLQAWGIILVVNFMRMNVTGSMSYEKLRRLYPEDSDNIDSILAQLIAAIAALFTWGVAAFVKFVIM
jgi:hypothetical protein